MTSHRTSITEILHKMKDHDPDERFMATSDLSDLLKNHATNDVNDIQMRTLFLDIHTEKQICTSILKLFDDPSNDVQAIAVKTLSVLLTSVHEEQVRDIADKLGHLVTDGSNPDLMDVYAIGLKTLISSIPSGMGDSVSSKLVKMLLKGIQTQSKVITSGECEKAVVELANQIIRICLESLNGLLARFGALPSVSSCHSDIFVISIAQLASLDNTIRKNASDVIGSLSVVVNDKILFIILDNLLFLIDSAEGVGKSGKRKTKRARSDGSKTLTSLLDEIILNHRITDTRALIRTMCNVSGGAGHRFTQEHINRIVPLFLKFCDPDDAVAGDDMNDDENYDMEEDDKEETSGNEIREICFMGFQSFISKCPALVRPHLPQIILVALAYMRHDPNFTYGDEGEMDEGAEDDDMEMEEDEEDEDSYSDSTDDDDDSWKVRRGAIRTISAIVDASKLDSSRLWIDEYAWKRKQSARITVAGALVERFKEREENCRVDIIQCFTRLLSLSITNVPDEVSALSASPDAMDTSGDFVHIDAQRNKFTPLIVLSCEKQLGSRKCGNRTMSAAIALLATLFSAPGGVGGSEQINSIFTHIRTPFRSLHDASKKSLKLESLYLLRVAITSKYHDPRHIKDALINLLFEDLCKVAQEQWYKLTSETLRIMNHIPRLMILAGSDNAEMKFVAKSLYDVIEPRLEAGDLDQEIKECALVAASSLLSVLHESLDSHQKNSMLASVLMRLKSDTTRLPAIKAITAISEVGVDDGLPLDMSSVFTDMVNELASLLALNNVSYSGIKQSALKCLIVIIGTHGSADSGQNFELYRSVMKDLSTLITDSNMHMTSLSLNACLTILNVCPACYSVMTDDLLPSVLTISSSTMLQDKGLESLLLLLRRIVENNAVDFKELINQLEARLCNDEMGGISKQALSNISKCIATVAAATDKNQQQEVVQNLLTTLEAGGEGTSDIRYLQLALRTSGNLGSLIDYTEIANARERLITVYFNYFESESEDIKYAAAYGFGRASVKAISSFLPHILAALNEKSDKTKYLLLTSLRELIYGQRSSGSCEITQYISEILPHLKLHSSDEAESVRTMVAEIMGLLACTNPDEIWPELQNLVTTYNDYASEDISVESSNRNKLICWTVANSVKVALGGHCESAKLLPYMPTFLTLLKARDFIVKHSALLMVYSAVNYSPNLAVEFMKDIMAELYELSQMSLKRQIDLGPFKHIVDDAIPIRNATLSIFSTCIDKCHTTTIIDNTTFLPSVLAKSLGDVKDVQIQAYQILISMCSSHPMDVVLFLDSFVGPLEKSIFAKKSSGNAASQDDKTNDKVKSALRVVIALMNVDGAKNCTSLLDLMEKVKKSFPNILDELQEGM